LILNGTHLFLVYVDHVITLGASEYTIKKKTEALLFGSKEVGLEVNADKTKRMVMSRERNITIKTKFHA
jgi:hypothetical protein